MPNLRRFAHLQWLFPIAVLVHNAEEAITMPAWASHHAAQLPVEPPSAAEIRIALLLLTLAVFGVTLGSAKKGRESIWAYLLFGGIVTMLLNVFVPHVPASLAFRGYTPGVITAVGINLPLMTLLAALALREKWVVGWKAALYAITVPIAVACAITTGLILARILL